MMKFLAVPLKKTNEIDFIKPLRSFIESMQLPPEKFMQLINALQTLNHLRSRVCIQNLDKTEESLNLLEIYYDQLCAIEKKIPISPSVYPIPFKWKDAFDKHVDFFAEIDEPSDIFGKLTICDSAFERACILFNCGALMSQIAATTLSVGSDEELITAKTLFGKAAGIFIYLKDTVVSRISEKLTPDLMPDTLAALSAIMLGQAHECLYLKASKGNTDDNAIVKIANQGSQFYKDVLMIMSKANMKGIFDNEWINNISSKDKGLEACANFHAARMCSSLEKIGEQVSRLIEVVRFLDETKSKWNYDHFRFLLDVPSALNLASRNNAYMYYQNVPDFKSLPKLEKAMFVKPVPIECYLSPGFKDIFEKIIPTPICYAPSAIDSRIKEVADFDPKLFYNPSLPVNIPATLENVSIQERCPESIRIKSAKIREFGGNRKIFAKIGEVQTLSARIGAMMKETQIRLNDKEKHFERHRHNYVDRIITAVRSQILLYNEVIRVYRGNLEDARKADNIIKSKIFEHSWGLELLNKSENELDEAFREIVELDNNVGTDERDNILDVLSTAYDAYFEIDDNLNEGLKFYNDLLLIYFELHGRIMSFFQRRR